MAMISLRADGSGILGMCDFTRLAGGKLQGAALAPPAPVLTGSPPPLHELSRTSFADSLGSGLGDVGHFRRSDLQQRFATHMHETQLPRREQSMDRFFHARSRNEVCQE